MVYEEAKPKKDKRMLTLFLLLMPSLIIAMSAAIAETLVRISIQVVLLLLQLVMFKNLIDDYYGG